jgi:small subunit ribosomal protein S8
MMTDPIADMLTRLRNAQASRHREASMPASRVKEAVARVLEARGYLADVRVEDGQGGRRTLHVGLRYRPDGTRLIDGLRRVSKPGRRVYVSAAEVPKVRNGLGIAVLSTSRGVMADEDARAQHVGGEWLCEVW